MDYANIMRAERERTANYGNDVEDTKEYPCPICGSTNYDYLIKGFDLDIVGCDDCCKKVYRDDDEYEQFDN